MTSMKWKINTLNKEIDKEENKMLHSGNRSEVKALLQEFVVTMDRPVDDPLRVAICDR